MVEEKLHVVKEHQRRPRRPSHDVPLPQVLGARSKVTCEWLAWFVHQKFGQLVPLDRIRRDLAERGIPLAMSTLVGFVERAADLLAPIDGHHWRTLLSSSWMATDGTGLKVLVTGLPAAHDGYIELYRNAECAVFQYAAHKGSDDVVAKIKPFRGTLTADAEHRFNDVYATGRVVEAGCNAPGRRKFRDAEKTSRSWRRTAVRSSPRCTPPRRRPRRLASPARRCARIGASTSARSRTSSRSGWPPSRRCCCPPTR